MRLAVFATAVLLASLALAATALGHAKLLRTDPQEGRTLAHPPRAVALTFSEEIDPALVRLQVRDRSGRRVDRGGPFHPGGRDEVVAVALAPQLEGTLVAHFRVISEDGHPVAQSVAFRVRPRPVAETQPAPPAATTAPPAAPTPMGDGGHRRHRVGHRHRRRVRRRPRARLPGDRARHRRRAVPVRRLAPRARAGRRAGSASGWASRAAFARRLRQVVLGAVVMGVLASATSIVLEAATAAGVSFWAALDRDIVDSVSSTRPVEAWTLRIVVWLALGIVLAAALRPRRVPTLRRTVLGATGAAVGPAPSRVQLLVFGALAIGLALTAPLAGHTGEHDPRALLICTDTMHVLCMSAWLGGLVMLLIVLGLAARRLPGRTGRG